MQVRHDRVAAPDQDQPAVLELLDIGAHPRTDRRDPARFAGGRADCPVEQRCSEPMEEAAVHRAVLQETHRAGIRIREDGLRSVGRCGDRGKFRGDRVQRFVPGNLLEAPLAFRAHTFHWMQHTLIRIRALEIVRDLGAQRPARRRMVGGAANLDRAPVFDRHLQGAGVGAVVRACSADDGAGGGARYVGIGRHGGRAPEPIL